MKNKLFRNNKGFSLLELIVAILILAIIGGASIAAFGSIFSTEMTVGATRVTDAMKQARTDAMAWENKTTAATEDYSTTNVYAKFYVSDGSLYVDVCKKPDGTGSTESVMFSREVGKNFKAGFYKVTSTTTGTSESEIVNTDSYTVNVYFKKSTGGVAGVAWQTSGGSLDGTTGINMIKLEKTTGAGTPQKIVLVEVTGRCYTEKVIN